MLQSMCLFFQQAEFMCLVACIKSEREQFAFQFMRDLCLKVNTVDLYAHHISLFGCPLHLCISYIQKIKSRTDLNSGFSIIADVAESIAETQLISINRIEIWDRLIGKNGKRTSLQRTNCYWRKYNIGKMAAPCVRHRQ